MLARPIVFAIAFWIWTIGAPVVAVLAASFELSAGPLACPVCGSTAAFCLHRTWLFALVHVAGSVVLAWRWTIVWNRTHSDRVVATRRPWRAGVAGLVVFALTGALALEFAVDVESVMGTGPIVAGLGGLVVGPGGDRLTRAVGAVAIVTPLVGLYTVASLRLSPDEAWMPLAVIGLVGLLAAALLTAMALVRVGARAAGLGPAESDELGEGGGDL